MFALKRLIFILIFTATVASGFKNGRRYKAVSEKMRLPEKRADSLYNEKTIDKRATNNITGDITKTHSYRHAYEKKEKRQKSTSIETELNYAPQFKHPSKMFNMDIKTAKSSVLLKCAADGNPMPTITWSKNDAPIARGYSQPSYGKWSMSLDELTKADDGNYTCLVCNDFGCISHTVALHVQECYPSKTYVKEGYPGNITAFVKDSVRLTCPLVTNVDTYLSWIKPDKNFTENFGGEEAIPNGVTIQSSERDYSRDLVLQDITIEDEGWYVCVVINVLGKEHTSSKGYLTVLDSPTVTSWSNSVAALMAFILAVVIVVIVIVIVKLKRDKQKIIQTTRELMSEQWTKIVSIERVLSNGYNGGTHTLRMPVVTIEKKKLIDVKKNYTYSVLTSEYVLPLDATWEISKQDVTLQKVLGEGEFGKVMKAECFGLPNSSTSKTVAVKMLKDGHSDADMIAFVSEMEIMKMVGKHENIVNLLGCCTRDGAPYIIEEYAENGCLREFLRKHKPGNKNSSTELKQQELVNFALQVANGMEYLVKRGCVHRDLAARNVLVSGARVLKVADFGLARDVRDSHYYRKHSPGKLPLRWMAPESICDNYYNNKSDVWSFGVLTWEIMTFGNTPYQHVPAHYLYHYLKLGKRVEKPTSCSEETYDLIKHCCTFNPDGRPTFSEIKETLQAIELKTLD